MSGSGSDTYDIKTVPIYNDNAEGDHILNNEGFEVEALSHKIFGHQAVRTQKKKADNSEQPSSRKKKKGRAAHESIESKDNISFMNDRSFLN